MLSPVLEWWLENFMLVRDAATRHLPLHLVSYNSVLEEPERIIPQTLKWLGRGEAAPAIAAVKPGSRTQDQSATAQVPDHPQAEVFDELFDLVHRQQSLSRSFIQRLNDAHGQLVDEIEAGFVRIAKSRMLNKRSPRQRPPVVNPDLVESMVHGPPEMADSGQ